MNPTIIQEEPVSIYDLAKELKKIKKQDTDLNIRTTKLEEYLNNFAVLKHKDAEDLEKEIVDMQIPRLRDLHIKKILDVCPTSHDEVKQVLSAYPVTISKENLIKIAEAVAKYAPKEK
ncbi:MAG: hypothetical protein V1859_07575 [archaeon]